VAELVQNHFFQVLELYRRRRIQFGKVRQTVEFLGLQRSLIGRIEPQMFQTNSADAVILVGRTHLLGPGKTSVGNFQKRIFFAAVQRHAILAAHALVHKFDFNVVANSIDVAVAPIFERIRGGFAATFINGTFIAAARWVGVDFRGLAVLDVYAPAVRPPSGNARCIVIVGIGDTAVVFVFEFVLGRIRGGIAALPEGLNKMVALFVVRELHEGLFFLVSNNVGHVFVHPLLKYIADFRFKSLLVFFFLFCGQRTDERILTGSWSGGRLIGRADGIRLIFL